MRTWSKRWPADSWRALLERLAAGRDALRELPEPARPLPFLELRAYDGEGRHHDLESDPGSVHLVEYDLRVPPNAAPLPAYATGSRDESGRRRLAAAVLRSLLQWQRLRLSYRMEPQAMLHVGDRVYCDLLQSVAAEDAELSWRQRCGVAGCLVLLLSPWPFGWPTAYAGTIPALLDRPDERSAWGIAANAVAALLDPDLQPANLGSLLTDTSDLLAAAARLGPRFPSWPAGLAREVIV